MTSLKAKVNAYDRPKSRPTSPFKTQVMPAPVAVTARPKARINTSAAFGPRKFAPTTSPSMLNLPRSAIPSPTPRPPSPFKPSQRLENQSFPTLNLVKPRANTPKSTVSVSPRTGPIGPHISKSNPSSPESSRQRRASLTIHHSKSTVSLAPRTAPTSPLVPGKPQPNLDSCGAGSSSLRNNQTPSRVTSKVTKMTKASSQDQPPVPNLPLNIPGRTTFTRPRVPSVSNISTLSSSPSSISSRPPSSMPNLTQHKRGISQPMNQPIYQAFQIDDDQTIHRSNSISSHMSPVAKVDPMLIPLPPHSPPTSNVSFSSRSSLSSASYDTQHSARTGGSVAATFNINKLTNGFKDEDEGDASSSRTRTAYNKSEEGSPLLTDQEDSNDNFDRRMKAEAKSMRKIADLEITNRSLMVINATLEAAKHRQAKEIRDLRRRLRESRLILPPKKYRQVESSLDHDDTADEDDEDDEDDENDGDFTDDKDEGFKRVRTILDGLLDQGRGALAAKPHDFEETKGATTKVLHAEDLRDRGDFLAPSVTTGPHLESDNDRQEYSEADITLPDSDDLDSENEVEDMISIRITSS